MDDKRRLNLGQWGNTPSWQGTGSAGNTPTPWTGAPGARDPQPWKLQEGDDPSSWGMFSDDEEVYQPGAGASYGHELLAGDLSDEGMYQQEPFDEEMDEEGVYGEEMYYVEDGYFSEEDASSEEDRHPLRDALFVLVVLYVVCCIVPLFVGLFVPLRVFFWLEVAGWVIILAWLIFGVRAPFMVWLKERRRMRLEHPLEEQGGAAEFAEEL